MVDRPGTPIIDNGFVLNVIVLDPQSTEGQSWLRGARGTEHLPLAAVLVKREAGEVVGPGTIVEVQ